MTNLKELLYKRFTIVYLDCKKELKLEFDEYLVLDSFVKMSDDSNAFVMKKSETSKYLKFSRERLNSIIISLESKRYFHKNKIEKKSFYVVDMVKDIFEMKRGVYVKIYHEKRKILGLEPLYFAFLYLIYSLSKNDKLNHRSSASINYYCSQLEISKKRYETIIKKMNEKKLLNCSTSRKLSLSFYIFEWFEKNRKKGFGDYLHD